MQSPARSAATRGMPRSQTGFPKIPALILSVAVALVLVITFMGQVQKSGHNSVSTQTVSDKPVHLVFEPPIVHNDLQSDNQALAIDVIHNPASRGLFNKPPVDLDGNPMQIWLSTLESENHFYHYNSNGDVVLSYSLCCVGIGQISRDTTDCPAAELKDIRNNLYCSAVIFNNYYQEYKVKAPDRAFELTVARYKNAVLLDDNGQMVLDSDGLPIIPGDSKNPESPRSQVDRVFIDPDTGKPMFRFVND